MALDRLKLIEVNDEEVVIEEFDSYHDLEKYAQKRSDDTHEKVKKSPPHEEEGEKKPLISNKLKMAVQSKKSSKKTGVATEKKLPNNDSAGSAPGGSDGKKEVFWDKLK